MRNHHSRLSQPTPFYAPAAAESPAPNGATAPEPPLWQQFRPMLGAAFVVFTAITLLVQDWQTQSLLVIMADDLSLSGLAVPDAVQQHCHQVLKQIKTGDHLIKLGYADRPETLYDAPVQNTIGLLRTCPNPEPPGTIGRRSGTSPTEMLEAVLIALESARVRGNTDPVVVSIWLQDAEPVPGDPPLDWERFQAQVDTLTTNNGVVTFFGPTGELQQNLKIHLKGNPQAEVWPITALDNSTTWAYGLARELSPLSTPWTAAPPETLGSETPAPLP
ncbi:hypothetical protein [Prochlorothrix hollandica]|uniref:hypothetical protein n=1 Tax=Prochlorothrix hollandica TaxID=1223 RepID=UPI003341DD1E